jgi:hypothetical protein
MLSYTLNGLVGQVPQQEGGCLLRAVGFVEGNQAATCQQGAAMLARCHMIAGRMDS